MSLGSDLRSAIKVITDALDRRRQGGELRHRLEAAGPLPPGRFEIAVHFPDDPMNLYQVRQWYAPLVELAKTHPVLIITRNVVASNQLMAESPLPVAFCHRVEDVEQVLATQPIKIVLYVNQNTRNFQMFRYGHRWHVFICHGESDKSYMSSNQIASYDYTFVAGQAAHDRLRPALWDYDLERRAIRIGRPQIDHLRESRSPLPVDGRTSLLYAPTWEGDRPAMSYGSIRSHGERLVEAVLADPRYRLVYRAHPRSGVNDPEYGAAHRRIVAAIEKANAADPGAGHLVDTGGQLDWQLAHTDVAVLDVSAMIYDRLAVGKPLLVTRPVRAEAEIDEQGYLQACEWLTADRAGSVLIEADRLRADPTAVADLARWSEHYFGDTTPGVATAAFQAAVERLLAEWESWHSGSVTAT